MDELIPVEGVESEFDRLASSLRADSRDLTTFLQVMAQKFEEALPGLVRVERARGLLGRGRRVTRISLQLGELRFDLSEPAGALEARATRVVRGIALKSDVLEPDLWLEQLARALTAQAQASSQARLALERLLS